MQLLPTSQASYEHLYMCCGLCRRTGFGHISFLVRWLLVIIFSYVLRTNIQLLIYTIFSVLSSLVHPLTLLKILFLVLELHSFFVHKLNVTPTGCMEIYSSISTPISLLNCEIKMSLRKILTTTVFLFLFFFLFLFTHFWKG